MKNSWRDAVAATEVVASRTRNMLGVLVEPMVQDGPSTVEESVGFVQIPVDS